MLSELTAELTLRGARFVKSVDITQLSKIERRDFSIALVIGVVFDPDYLYHFLVENENDHTGFTDKEHEADALSVCAEQWLQQQGYEAFAQTERNIVLNGLYDDVSKSSVLPHKKIAVLAGVGWIGKHNLLVTEQYGSALCISTVLTNAPLPFGKASIRQPACGDCHLCQDRCPKKALKGTTWQVGISRDELVDISLCDFCLKCLASCPYTKKYMQTSSKKYARTRASI